MRVVLFCEQKYAISILEPLQNKALEYGYQVLWFVDKRKINEFNASSTQARWTNSIQEVYDFNPEVIFVPGNIVPYYLPGVKVQVFHGYAGEKKGHFIIRKYFDLYVTQGPFFTKRFQELAKKYQSFEVVETGWPRQDWVFENKNRFDADKRELLQQYGKEKIVLYAPTFSPSLTSLPLIKQELKRLIDQRDDILLLFKFHPLTKMEWVEEYKQFAEENEQAIWCTDDNVSKYLFMADVMISDTSSVVYEFRLLNKPVITLNSISQNIQWKNIASAEELIPAFEEVEAKEQSSDSNWVIENYDPYRDGKSSERIFDAVEDYIQRNGVPRMKKLNLWRRYTSIKKFGKIKR